MAQRKKSSYVIQSVVAALDLLEVFGGEEAELGVVQISQRLGVHKNTAFRLAATLESRRYLEQNPESGNYRPGLAALELRQAFLSHRELFSMARPVLREVAGRCGETAYLGVIRNGLAVYLEAVETEHPVHVALRVGTGLPVHCTAMGKVQIAFLRPDRQERLVESLELAARTARTITRGDDLLRELAEVRARGYATDLDEFEDGVCCVAAPVRDWSGEVVAGISINGPSYRFPDSRFAHELGPLVRAAGRDLSAALGWSRGTEETEAEAGSGVDIGGSLLRGEERPGA